VTVARANAVKNVCVRTTQIGSRKIAKTNFTHRVGTVSGSGAATKLLDLARATLRTTLLPRLELRVPRLFIGLRFVLAKVAQITQAYRKKSKTEPRITRMASAIVGQALRLPASAIPKAFGVALQWRYDESRPPQVGPGAGVDLDCLAFFDEKRDVDFLSALKRRRLCDVARSIAAHAFG